MEPNNFSNPLAIAKRARQKGKISRLLLIGAGLVFLIIVVIIIVFAVQGNNAGKNQENVASTDLEPPKPVYEKQIGDMYFALESSENLGNILEAKYPYQKDVVTTERFIRVVIGVQNKGKVTTAPNIWDMGNIIDSEGRIFANVNNTVFSFLPNPNPCGLSLKPAFYPVTCTKIYEVSKISEGLKVEVMEKSQGKIELLDLNLDK